MPTAHIVMGHPHSQSFNAHLATSARTALEAKGWTVSVSDLAAMKFDPVEGPHHNPQRDPSTGFSVQREQRLALADDRTPNDVKEEITRLEQADLLVLQFPLWWFGAPAILKGWLDRVFISGKAYTSPMRHDRGIFKCKRAVLSVTCGAPEEAFAYNGRNGDIDLILWPINFSLSYVGYSVVKPLIFYGVKAEAPDRPDEALKTLLATHAVDMQARMATIENADTLRFNSLDDWENDRLKPGVRGYSLAMRAEP